MADGRTSHENHVECPGRPLVECGGRDQQRDHDRRGDVGEYARPCPQGAPQSTTLAIAFRRLSLVAFGQ
eukprot:415024-Heterocapsa_arctica.AAC.1